MSDKTYIGVFTVIGLIVAYLVTGPIRRSDADQPRIGTPLSEAQLNPEGKATGEVYAEGTITSSQPAAAGSTLFIIARAAERGAPLAAQKISSPRFPLVYSLTTADNTAGDNFYPGALKIIARLDADGLAGPRQPEDREGSAEFKEGGSRKIDLKIE